MTENKYILISMHVSSPEFTVTVAEVPITTIPTGSLEMIMS